jgi:exodeoxyribonuclease V beta subunit
MDFSRAKSQARRRGRPVSRLTYRRPPIIEQVPLGMHSVIEASAGTGKTFTIEHLVLRILCEERARLEQILVVTFTEKATADLRARIRARIDKVLSGHGAENKADGAEVPLSDGQRKVLEEALFSFERAPIHTIHSFCQRTLSELAFLMGASFAVDLVDAQEAFHDAFRAELREGLAREPQWNALVEAWLAERRRENRREEEGPKALETLLYEAHRLRYLATGDPERNREAIDALIASFDSKRLRAEYSKSVIHKNSQVKALAAIEAVERAVQEGKGDRALIRTALRGTDFAKLIDPTLNKGGENFLAELPERCRRFRESARNAQRAITLGATIADAMLPAVTRRLEAQKRERGTMDYDDMLRWLADALDGAQGAAIAAELRRRYRFALIDEFQDTDDLQWRIFRRVFVDEASENVLCLIGDPKQAIYSFRGADVYSYLRARTELCKGGNNPLPLRRNYRSTKKMLDALNLIFDQNASHAILTPEIPFDPNVTCGKVGLDARDASGRALAPITLLEYETERPGVPDSARVIRVRLGREIAAILRDLLPEETGRISIVDPDNRDKSERLVKPRDIFILTRTNSEASEIGEYLREAGVPYAFYKRDGLFRTREAGDILDVLRAIEDPLDRSRRLKAWNTPFFAVPYHQLAGLDGLGPEHPLNARLSEWKEMADGERFAELFDSMMMRSGLALRELLFSNSERELTNYEHILEILLEQTIARRLSLAELIELLAGYVAQRATPPGENSNVERLESERAAVQIMTVHMSKGLEADVVVLFGGIGPSPDRNAAAAFHDPTTGERHVAVSRQAKDLAKELIDAERTDEDRRLAYVALTRARARMFLPVIPEKCAKQSPRGYYRFINDRLQAAAAEDAKRPARERLLERVEAARTTPPADGKQLRAALASFDPPSGLLTDDLSLDAALGALGEERHALEVLSYTALDRIAAAASAVELEDFKIDPEAETAATPPDDQLRGGRNVGLFLHEAIERTALDKLLAASDRAAWSARAEVREILETAARRHQVTDPRWIEKGLEIVFNALRSPVAAGTAMIENLASCETAREMEFVYPIPAPNHRLLSDAHGTDWRIERGVLVGFADLVFRHAGKVYFADWKSDRLAAYDADTVRRHVEVNYALQAKIYTVGVVRLLGIRDEAGYEARFGGLLYIFLRGIVPDGGGTRGICFHRPNWDEVVGYERELMNPERAAAELR